jgi:hypothetical protein
MLPTNVQSPYLSVNLLMIDVKSINGQNQDVSYVVHTPSKFFQTVASVCYSSAKPISKIINLENEASNL